MYHFSIFAQPFSIPHFQMLIVAIQYVFDTDVESVEFIVEKWASILEKKRGKYRKRNRIGCTIWMEICLMVDKKLQNWYNCPMQSFYVDFQFYHWMFRSCYSSIEMVLFSQVFFSLFDWENVSSIIDFISKINHHC